jgi:uncharacterized protein DUF1488
MSSIDHWLPAAEIAWRRFVVEQVSLGTHCEPQFIMGLLVARGGCLLGFGEEIGVPLTRLKDEYLEQDGVRFLMEDEAGSTVACRVSHEALRDHAERMHFSGTDGAVFEAYRELIEEVASEAHAAERPFDAHGRILVTSVRSGCADDEDLAAVLD